MIRGQLSFDLEEKLDFNFNNYNWLKGNKDNLKEFFLSELVLIDYKIPKLKEEIRENLKKDCIRRLKELGIKGELIGKR